MHFHLKSVKHEKNSQWEIVQVSVSARKTDAMVQYAEKAVVSISAERET